MQVLLYKTGVMQTGNDLDKLPQKLNSLVHGCQTVPDLKGGLCIGQEIENQSWRCIVQFSGKEKFRCRDTSTFQSCDTSFFPGPMSLGCLWMKKQFDDHCSIVP